MYLGIFVQVRFFSYEFVFALLMGLAITSVFSFSFKQRLSIYITFRRQSFYTRPHVRIINVIVTGHILNNVKQDRQCT